MTTRYLATVYGDAITIKGHPTMREAFDWIKQSARWDEGFEKAVVTHGKRRLLLTFTRETTRWYRDGYQRWEQGI